VLECWTNAQFTRRRSPKHGAAVACAGPRGMKAYAR